MPVRTVPNADPTHLTTYYLVCFNAAGEERKEDDGTLLSETITSLFQSAATSSSPYTDIFFCSHGWHGDVPAAIAQYDKWIGAMVSPLTQSDRDAAHRQIKGFKPLIVGLHWPSEPWGDEDIPDGVQIITDKEVKACAKRIVDTDKARESIRTILETANSVKDPKDIPPTVDGAFDTLAKEAGVTKHNVKVPLEERVPMGGPADWEKITESVKPKPMAGPGVLGITDWLHTAKDILLAGLRQFSFYTMKNRARVVGESGGHTLLKQIQEAAPNARCHLMGHSFGCIVVSATTAGPDHPDIQPLPVHSLFLAQGALSLWSYANDIPFAVGTPGHFNQIVKTGLVNGPIVTTRSHFDTADRILYPAAATFASQLVLGDTKYPKYGAVGTFGLQGIDPKQTAEWTMKSTSQPYTFQAKHFYNLEASGIIRNGGGFAGAHNDIAHPEVAHAFWAAILSGTLDTAPLSTGTPTETTPAEHNTEVIQQWVNVKVAPGPINSWRKIEVTVTPAQSASGTASAQVDVSKLFGSGATTAQISIIVEGGSEISIKPQTRTTVISKSTGVHLQTFAAMGPSPAHIKVSLQKDGVDVPGISFDF